MSSAKNISASVRARLLNIARKENRPFGELLQYYAMERFLYRLSVSRHSDRFILKGALMLRAWQSPVIRPTMDIDMLGRTSQSEQDVVNQVREILGIEVVSDGLAFDHDSIKTEPITEDSDYAGLRVRLSKNLFNRNKRYTSFSGESLIRPGIECKHSHAEAF